MHDTGLRINGGIGFAIENPSLDIYIKPSRSFIVNDNRKFGLSVEAKNRLLSSLICALNNYSLHKAAKIDIFGEAIANHGFGSGTAIRLASLEALLYINGIKLPNEELIRLSGRGGTSGIGINTYFSGGAIIDLGIRRSNRISKRVHKPSSAISNITPPLFFQRHEMPLWNIGVCIPLNINPLTKRQEEEFFKKICPIKESEAHKSFYHSIMGVMASIYEKDKEAFELSIREIQKCEWKHAERNCYGNALLEIEKILYEKGASVVGMSSLGPSLYFLATDIDRVIIQARNDLPNCIFFKTFPSNNGREIRC